jgi:hypothetical protein
LRVEQDLRSKGIGPEVEGFQKDVTSGGDLAIGEYTSESERSIKSTENAIVATEKQRVALGLLGEQYVRRSAELQMEAELIERNGSATDDFSQQQIQLAGDLAVATDQLNRQNDALRQLADSGLTLNEQMRQLAHDGLMSMEDALVDIITGTKSVKEAFRDMAKSIAADLARMAIRQAITVPLAGLLSSAFMGPAAMAAGPAFGGFTSAAAVGPISWATPMHTGGIIGTEIGGAPRMADPAMFKSAPRFHSGKMPANGNSRMPSRMPGLGGGEIATILKKDEGVFTPNQMKALAPAGGNQTVVVSPNITVNQPPGATEQQGQSFGKAISRELQAMVDERIQRAYRPGGLRNP